MDSIGFRLGQPPLFAENGRARSLAKMNYNDMILTFSLIHSGIDIVRKWDAFGQCSRPLHLWLLVSYAAMLTFRAAHHIGQGPSEDSAEFALRYIKQQGASRLFIRGTWFLLLPFFAAWTVLGTTWSLSILHATPTCLPIGTHFWFILLWQILCYAWTTIYSLFVCMAVQYERSLNAMEKYHHCLAATEDAVQRWGHLPFLPEYDGRLQSKGLCPGEIQSLPRSCFGEVACKCHPRHDCAICLMEFQSRDVCRELPGCGHIFHESCIDLWLLRRGDCPLCKHPIQACNACSCI